ncbi:MAG: Integral rane protein PqiA family [Nevskia sp.]|nr:Integral rane protein PqiA family [Nevskia sp.]
MKRPLTARRAGLLLCATCDLLSHRIARRGLRCPRCGEKIYLRKPRSLSRTLAYLIAAAILYIPANLLPIMHTETFLGSEDDTIMSGVIVLINTGSWPLALLVFFASIVVPMVKLLALSILVLSVRYNWKSHPRERSRLYRLIEFIGRWSMLDIYVVTLLVALVQLRALATIEPRGGAMAFGGVVVLTILASRSFDPRLMWDRQGAA